MSTLTPKNIERHELIGLKVIAENILQKAIVSGTVLDESKNMITIFDGFKKKRIVKVNYVFKFILPDESKIIINGKNIVCRSEYRTEKLRRFYS